MIRPACIDDLDEIARIEALSTPHAWSVASLTASLAQPQVVAFVADIGRIAGHVLAQASADNAEIHLIAVDPTLRRSGLGTALLEHAVAAWKSAGATEGWLEVRADNAAAIALYRKTGFQEAGRRRAYYRDGTDAVRMRLRW